MAAAASLLIVIAVGVYLVLADFGALATGYAVGAAALVGGLVLRWVDQLLPAPPQPSRPLLRLRSVRQRTTSRPASLLDWESTLLASRVHGWASRTFGNRMAPLVHTTLLARRGLAPDDPLVDELLGPTWSAIRPHDPGAHADGPGTSLDDIDDLTGRLERL